MGAEPLFQQNTILKVKAWPLTAGQATRRFGALHSSGIGTLWFKWVDWVAKASDEKAIQIMKGTFPNVEKLGLTGNIVVIYYAFMIFQSVAIAIFAVEYLRSFSIFESIKRQTRCKVADDDQSSMESHNTQASILTEQPAADLTICQTQLKQEATTAIGQNGDDHGMRTEGGDSTPIYYIDDPCANVAAAKDG
ncbi:unnamed protein product [Orchesella dallaii]|uniref:Uncharacterized protein n=1 Tax=Orchesella dallaii TaxID=48710 RepID=A0ABP1RTK9_9HEXA